MIINFHCRVICSVCGSFALPQHAARSSALQMSMDSRAKDPIKFGIIGCGRIGIVHLGAINKATGVRPVVSNPTVSKAEDGELTGV